MTNKKIVLIFIILILSIALNKATSILLNKIENFYSKPLPLPLIFDAIVLNQTNYKIMQTGYYNIIAAGAATANIPAGTFFASTNQQGKGEVVLYENIKLNENDILTINNGKIGNINYGTFFSRGKHSNRGINSIESGTPTTISINDNNIITANPGIGNNSSDINTLLQNGKVVVSDAPKSPNNYANSINIKNINLSPRIDPGNIPGYNTGNGFVIIYPTINNTLNTITPSPSPSPAHVTPTVYTTPSPSPSQPNVTPTVYTTPSPSPSQPNVTPTVYTTPSQPNVTPKVYTTPSQPNVTPTVYTTPSQPNVTPTVYTTPSQPNVTPTVYTTPSQPNVTPTVYTTPSQPVYSPVSYSPSPSSSDYKTNFGPVTSPTFLNTPTSYGPSPSS